MSRRKIWSSSESVDPTEETDSTEETSSSYSEAWDARASPGLYTLMATYHRGDLVRVARSTDSATEPTLPDHLYRVVGSKVSPTSMATTFKIREVISLRTYEVASKDLRPLGREPPATEDPYASGYPPSFLRDISPDYLYLTGSQDYQVLLEYVPRGFYAIKPVTLDRKDASAKRLASRLVETATEGGWTLTSSRKGGVVLALSSAPRGAHGEDDEGWTPTHQQLLYRATVKACRFRKSQPRRAIVLGLVGDIPSYGASASEGPFRQAKFRGHNVFVFSWAARPSKIQMAAICGLARVGGRARTYEEGVLKVPGKK